MSVLLPALLIGANLTGQNADPLAPAAGGKLQCYLPDAATRTCQSMASYRSDGKGGFLNGAEVLIRPGITLESVGTVRVKDGAVCGFIQRAELEAGILRSDGKAVEGDARREILNPVVEAFAPLFGREICTIYVPSGDHLLAIGTLDGVPDRLPEAKVIWVSPEDGYRVAAP